MAGGASTSTARNTARSGRARNSSHANWPRRSSAVEPQWSTASREQPATPRASPGLRVAREAEQTLGDDVALDLAGAAGDRQATAGEEGVDPHRRVAVVDRRLLTQQGQGQLRHSLVVLDPQQLANARLRARLRARQRPQGGPEPEQRQRL